MQHSMHSMRALFHHENRNRNCIHEYYLCGKLIGDTHSFSFALESSIRLCSSILCATASLVYQVIRHSYDTIPTVKSFSFICMS